MIQVKNTDQKYCPEAQTDMNIGRSKSMKTHLLGKTDGTLPQPLET